MQATINDFPDRKITDKELYFVNPNEYYLTTKILVGNNPETVQKITLYPETLEEALAICPESRSGYCIWVWGILSGPLQLVDDDTRKPL